MGDTPQFGGQAVPEGVMVRGVERWAIAVRRPDGGIWVESHPVPSPATGGWRRAPLLRGAAALGASLAIGTRALEIAVRRSAEDDLDDVAELPIGASLAVAATMVVGLLVVLPTAATLGVDALTGARLGDAVAFHLAESGVRLLILIAYVAGLARLARVRRVFAYHGAEHATIATWEDDADLDVAAVAARSTRHVRCGGNFLIQSVLVLTVLLVLAGALLPVPDDPSAPARVAGHLGLRLLALPVAAGLAYELLRLGARHGGRWPVAALMRPGLWLQRITTRTPDAGQIEIALRAFEAALPDGLAPQRRPIDLPSPVTVAPFGLPVHLADAAGGQPTEPSEGPRT